MRFVGLSMFLLGACTATPPVAIVDAGLPVSERDGGSSVDAGLPLDAGQLDAGLVDAGFDAGVEDAGTTLDGGARDPLVIARPFDLTVPVGYRPGTPVPLLLLLHGYTATAQLQDTYFGYSQLAQQRTFLVALPNGLRDDALQQYWNATDACCAFGKTNDDVAYLTAVIRDVQARYTVDPKRIYVVGHSNGGFMAHRLACDRANLIAGIMAFAGNTWADPSSCQPTEGVAVLQVHGTLDAVVLYNGGATVGQPPYPSARDSVRSWGPKNGCTGTTLDPIGGNLDLAAAIFGNETDRAGLTGCPGHTAAELWTVNGASHIPVLTSDFAERTYTWLLAHPKP